MKIKKSLDRLSTLGLWVLIVVLFMSLLRNLDRARRVNKEIGAQKEELSKIQADNEKLQQDLMQAQSPEFLEKQVRDKLGLVREGETIVVLPDADVLRKLAPKLPVETNALPDPNWKKWLKLFI